MLQRVWQNSLTKHCVHQFSISLATCLKLMSFEIKWWIGGMGIRHLTSDVCPVSARLILRISSAVVSRNADRLLHCRLPIANGISMEVDAKIISISEWKWLAISSPYLIQAQHRSEIVLVPPTFLDVWQTWAVASTSQSRLSLREAAIMHASRLYFTLYGFSGWSVLRIKLGSPVIRRVTHPLNVVLQYNTADISKF